MPSAPTQVKRRRGRPHIENLLEGLHNLDTGEEAPDTSAAALADNKSRRQVFKVSTADLMHATGYGSERIADLRTQGIIRSISQGVWDAMETMGAMVKRLRERQDRFSTEDKARKLKADADNAEFKALSSGDDICLMEHAHQYWSDSRIAVRQAIERADYIPAAMREKLLNEIASMKPVKFTTVKLYGDEEKDEEEDRISLIS